MTELEKMLAYYGYKTIEEFGEAAGYYNKKDAGTDILPHRSGKQ